MTVRRGKQIRSHYYAKILCLLLPVLLALLLSSCVTAPQEHKVDNYWDGYTTVAISPSGKIVAAANRFIVVLFDIEQRRQVGWFWAVDQKGKNFNLPRTVLVTRLPL